MGTPLRVLIVEDSPDDADLILLELRRAGFDVQARRVETAAEMRQALENTDWDTILSDHAMPRFSSGAALQLLKEVHKDLPFIIVSGSIGEEHAVRAMRAGCHDYIMKDNLARLAPAVQRELREAEVRRSHRAAELQLRRSEERLRLLFEASLDAIMIADETGRFVQVNEAACRLFGYPREQLSRMALTDIPTRDTGEATAQLERYRQRGEDTGTFTFRRADGDWRVAEYSARRFAPELHVRILRDVTERRRDEEALRASEERFALFMQNLPGIAFIKDVQGRYVFMNDLMQRTFSLRRDDWLGRTDAEIWPDGRGFQRKDAEVLRQARCVETSETTVGPGSSQEWLVSKFPLVDAHGRVIMLGGIGIDITERRRAEEKRQQLQSQLQQAQKLESLGVLAGGIAHDFNNLLTIIINNAQFLKESRTLEPPLANVLQDIETAATHAADMTRSLQAFSRPHAPQVRTVDANAIISDVHRLLRRLIPAMIDFHVQPAPEPCPMDVDPAQIQQALVNLCVNARDAMPGGGLLELECDKVSAEELPLTLRQKLHEERYVRLTVRDSGSGMDADTLQRAFDPFFTTKPKDRGTGLGLAIVYGIMEAHRGGIDVSSEPGRGTTFELYFPASSREVATPPAPPAAPQHGVGRILVVDDEEMIASLLKTLLESRGYSVTVANRAEHAIQAVKSGSAPDLVIIDYSMPHMTGDLCLREMRRTVPELKAILITGYEVDEASRLPEDVIVLPKPFTTQVLTETVRQVLESKPGA